MKNKKIAFIMDSPFTFGGEQRVVSKVASLLAAEGYNVSIICTRYKNVRNNMYNINKKVKIVNVSSNSKVDELILRINHKLRKINSSYHFMPDCFLKRVMLTKKIRNNIFKELNEEKYDYVVGVASIYSLFLAVYRDNIYEKTKIIGWQHNNFEAYFNKKGRRMYNEKNIFRKYAKNFDKYIVLMNDDKNKIEEHFGISCYKIFNPLSFDTSVKTNLNEKKFVFVGRIEKAKGVDLLLNAYKNYVNLGGNWKLNIIGDGSQKNEMIQKCHSLGLDRYVTFVGFTENVQKYLVDASISLIPSRWEGFGLVLTESMQFGLPTICFDLSPFKEITEGFKSSILVEQFNIKRYAYEMYTLSSDKDKLEEMSLEAIKNSKVFEGKAIVKEWIKIFEELDKKNEN